MYHQAWSNPTLLLTLWLLFKAKAKIDAGLPYSKVYDSFNDPHVAAGIIKVYFSI